MPRHSNNMVPIKATKTRKRVLVMKSHIALVGGSDDFADFQETPPLGSSIVGNGALGVVSRPPLS